jgi:hypothetical protein
VPVIGWRGSGGPGSGGPGSGDDGPDLPRPRRPGPGCLLAAIVAGIGLLVTLVLAARLLTSALTGVTIR